MISCQSTFIDEKAVRVSIVNGQRHISIGQEKTERKSSVVRSAQNKKTTIRVSTTKKYAAQNIQGKSKDGMLDDLGMLCLR